MINKVDMSVLQLFVFEGTFLVIANHRGICQMWLMIASLIYIYI